MMLIEKNSKEMLFEVVERLPSYQVEKILSFARFIEVENNIGKINNIILSERILAQDRSSEEDDAAWADL